jgi:hypothetical protein
VIFSQWSLNTVMLFIVVHVYQCLTENFHSCIMNNGGRRLLHNHWCLSTILCSITLQDNLHILCCKNLESHTVFNITVITKSLYQSVSLYDFRLTCTRKLFGKFSVDFTNTLCNPVGMKPSTTKNTMWLIKFSFQ